MEVQQSQLLCCVPTRLASTCSPLEALVVSIEEGRCVSDGGMGGRCVSDGGIGRREMCK